MMRFPFTTGPVGAVGPDSATKAWSIFSAGNPLPAKVDGWMNVTLTGATLSNQFQSANVSMLALVVSKP